MLKVVKRATDEIGIDPSLKMLDKLKHMMTTKKRKKIGQLNEEHKVWLKIKEGIN
jgi:hypothetical protein